MVDKDGKIPKGVKILLYTTISLMLVLIASTIYLIWSLNQPMIVGPPQYQALGELPVVGEDSQVTKPDELPAGDPNWEDSQVTKESHPQRPRRIIMEHEPSEDIVPVPESFSNITPAEWKVLSQSKGEHIILISSALCQPCKYFMENTINKYKETNPDVPYFVFEVSKDINNRLWLDNQPITHHVREKTSFAGIPTPTILFMNGNEVVSYEIGGLDLEGFLGLVNDVF